MTTRKRANKSMPAGETTEKLLTKKEAEARATLNMTCPVLRKKHCSPIQANNLIVSDETARVISFAKPRQLSSNYMPEVCKSYLAQLYQIQDKIGEGSFGVVYKAFCRDDEEFYAVKISRLCHREMSYNEVKLLEKIDSHPNVIKFYFAWEEMNMVFMQLELCALSLDAYAKTNHTIPEEQLWDIVIDMLRALNHLHDRRLIHLDIKPDNIMLSTDGLYKLGDFGLLYDMNDEHVALRKKYDLVEGDAKYLAKEVLEEEKITPAADIFSLGITMLELATDLVLPVYGPLWQRLRSGTYSEACFDEVPIRMKNLICKMMAPKPSLRPKAKQILGSSFIKQILNVQSAKPRVNYYEKWHAEAIENMDCQPVAVCVNVNNRSPELGLVDNGTPCVTPPRKVSRVIIYNV